MKLNEMFHMVDMNFRDTYGRVYERYFDENDHGVSNEDKSLRTTIMVLEKMMSSRVYEDLVVRYFWSRQLNKDFQKIMNDVWDIEVRSYHLEDIWNSFIKKLSLDTWIIRTSGRGRELCELLVTCVVERYIEKLDELFDEKYNKHDQKQRQVAVENERKDQIANKDLIHHTIESDMRKSINSESNNNGYGNQKYGNNFHIPSDIVNVSNDHSIDDIFDDQKQVPIESNEQQNQKQTSQKKLVESNDESFDDLFRVVSSSKKRSRSRGF